MCSMDAFGLTASVSKISGLCTLPVNIVNEKIYLILWFVFLAHTFVALLQLIRQAYYESGKGVMCQKGKERK